MKTLRATQNISVFVEKKGIGVHNLPIEKTNIGKIPASRRENIDWKGCVYTIKKGEVFFFDRSNNWDKSYFKLKCGVEFCIECGDPEKYLKRENVLILD